MKLKSLAVITLLVLACSFASAQVSLGFLSSGGIGEYCNYEQLTNIPGTIVWQGFDNASPCGLSNSTIVGAGMTASSSKFLGVPTPGVGVGYADNFFDVYFNANTGLQLWDFTLLKPSKSLGKYGWLILLGSSGYAFIDNFGYLTATIPAKGNAQLKGHAAQANQKLAIKGH